MTLWLVVSCKQQRHTKFFSWGSKHCIKISGAWKPLWHEQYCTHRTLCHISMPALHTEFIHGLCHGKLMVHLVCPTTDGDQSGFLVIPQEICLARMSFWASKSLAQCSGSKSKLSLYCILLFGSSSPPALEICFTAHPGNVQQVARGMLRRMWEFSCFVYLYDLRDDVHT